MKKNLLLLFVLIMLPMVASAYPVRINGICYILTSDEVSNNAEVVSDPNKYSGSVEIPATVEYKNVTYNVTSIGDGAFSYCSGLTSITIPNSVTSIDEKAFYECTGLTSVTIPNSVTSIGQYTFFHCTSLTSVTIGNSVASISDHAFYKCTGLTSVTIGNSVTTIGEYAFANCSGLTSVSIPNSVTSIGNNAFSGCKGLKSVTFGNSVTTIGEYAFANCSGLTSVHITDLAAWCGTSFGRYYCNPLYYAHHLFLNGEEIKDLVVPNSVASIGEYAFEGCSGLTSVTIPNSVTSIGYAAFSECSSLTSVTIGNSVTSIGEHAFHYCSSLTSITIPNSVTSIGNNAFSSCTSMTSIAVESGNTVFDSRENCNAIIYTSSNTLIAGCQNTIIPNSVTSIGDAAFFQCKSLTSVTIPNSVTSIGYFAFRDCTGLTSVTIPNSVTSIGESAFYVNGLLEVISKIENPFSTYAFADKTYNNATLYVPIGTIEKYKATEAWNKFINIKEGNPKIHKLTYLVDNEEYKSFDIEEGEAITPEPAPTKEGHTFSGWSEIPETMPAHDVTVTGTFSINKYKLTYKVDGETYKEYDVEYGASITPEAAPTKEGYTFSGWSEIPETMPAHDVTVTGTFSINKYKLTYIVDGETYKEYDVEYGTTITAEDAPTKEGYTFSGWSEIPETMPAHDVTITGTFTINKYKLTYKVDGEVYKSYDVEYGASITPEAAPTKEGYTFSGWGEIPETMPAHDVTVTGTFTINKYKLIYKVDGEVYRSYDVEYGASITPEAEPTKEGHTFSGWSVIPETMPAHDVTVTGTFSKGAYKLIYRVDDEVYKIISYDFGDVITPEPPPTKDGYSFSGWSEIPETMPAYDVTVTGTFSINKYKLTYIVDGEEYKSYEVEYGATITPETEPTKEGHTFSGWSEIPETMPAHDVTVTGTFTLNKYKVTYKVGDTVIATEDVEYGATIVPPTTDSEGNAINWSSHPTKMPAYDITIYGTYATGIVGINNDDAECQFFTLDGQRIEYPRKGVNIVRMSDGAVKKIIVK